MTSSSETPLVEGPWALDTMVLVYSCLEGHPGAATCEAIIREPHPWLTSSLVLFETLAVLTKVYGIPQGEAVTKLEQFVAGPVEVVAPNADDALAAMRLAHHLGIDLTDAALLQSCIARAAAALVTDDSALAAAGESHGIAAVSPLDAGLRQQVAAWESANLPAKGLPRSLRRIRAWLTDRHSAAAAEFWSHTGSGSHLP